MRVATFNVENLDDGRPERLEVLRPALERLDADIVCLQEVNGQHLPGRPERELVALDELLRGTRYAGYHRTATTAPGHTTGHPADVHNLVTLSRFDIVAVRQFRNTLLPPASVRLVTAVPPRAQPLDVGFDRPVLLTEVVADGRRLHILNVHLRAPLATAIPGAKSAPFTWRSVPAWAEGFYLSALKRSGQALELRLVIDSLFDADREATIIVAGDFNAEDHEMPLRLATGAAEDTGNADLTGRALIVLDRAIEAGRRFSCLHHGRPQMLDHILVSHAMGGHFRAIEVHNEALGDEAIGYAKNIEPAGSYHAAVVAEFRD